MHSPHQRLPRQGLILLALLSLGWGLNWAVMKVVISEVPPLYFRAVCLIVGGLGLLALARLTGGAVRVPTGQWGRLALLSLCNIVGWNVFAIYGVALLPSGRAALLGYTMPLWGALLSVWLLGEKVTVRRLISLGLGLAGIVALLMFASPFALPRADTPEAETGTLAWHAFEPEKIPQLVASGKTVFVDLTASWCLTCHANKRFVIDSDDVTAALSASNVYLMLGDWTQPNEQIAAFLRTYQRGGIPFNMVVGPNMTTGIILPELLTKSAVIEALDKAK